MGYVTPRHQKMVVHHHWYWQFAPPCHALPIPALPKTPKNWCFGTSDNSPNMILEIGQLVGRLSKSNPGPVPQHFITVSCSCHPHASIEWARAYKLSPEYLVIHSIQKHSILQCFQICSISNTWHLRCCSRSLCCSQHAVAAWCGSIWSMGFSGTQNLSCCTIFLAIFCGEIPLHRPLIWGLMNHKCCRLELFIQHPASLNSV